MQVEKIKSVLQKLDLSRLNHSLSMGGELFAISKFITNKKVDKYYFCDGEIKEGKALNNKKIHKYYFYVLKK